MFSVCMGESLPPNGQQGGQSPESVGKPTVKAVVRDEEQINPDAVVEVMEEEDFEPLPDTSDKPLAPAAPVDAAEEILSEEKPAASSVTSSEITPVVTEEKKEDKKEEVDYFADMEPEIKKAPTLDIPSTTTEQPKHSFAADITPEEESAAESAW